MPKSTNQTRHIRIRCRAMSVGMEALRGRPVYRIERTALRPEISDALRLMYSVAKHFEGPHYKLVDFLGEILETYAAETFPERAEPGLTMAEFKARRAAGERQEEFVRRAIQAAEHAQEASQL